MIEVKDLCFSRTDGDSKHNILNQLNLSVPAAQHLALLGDSGSGKTTFLHIIAGLLQADSGSVNVNNQELTLLNDKQLALYRRKIGLIFQQYQLLDCLTVKQNILFQHKLNFAGKAATEFDSLVDSLGLSQKLHALPHQLSGGEQQRVGIARALLNKPQIIFADEPTGNLDPNTSQRVFRALQDIARQEQVAVLVATHNLELSTLMDRVLTLQDGKLVTARSETSADSL